MATNRPILFAATAGAVVFLGAASAPGDGLYFAEKAYPKPPAMPAQRAVVAFRDGTERLIVESALDADGQRFGWIVPVPAKPTAFEEVPPGLLKTLSLCIQPRVVGRSADLRMLGWLGSVAAVAVLAWMLAVLVVRPRSRWTAGALLPALVVGAVVLLLPFSSDQAGMREAADVPGVRAADALVVGSYDVILLEADSPAALGRWLDRNGFAGLPPQGDSVVGDYIRRGWHFVAARLSRRGGGLCRPHPLGITFPADRPVYPIRLTALAGGPVALELFVVADGRAAAKGLTLDLSDTYRHGPARRAGDDRTTGKPVTGEAFGLEIGHPAAADVMWDGCCLTKLSGVLQPGDMSADVAPALGPRRPHWRRLYTRGGADAVARASGLAVWGLLLPVCLLAAYGRFRRPDGRRFALMWICVPVLVLAYAAGAGVYWLLPKTEVLTRAPRAGLVDHLRGEQVRDLLRGSGALEGRGLEDARRAFREHFLCAMLPNRLAGGFVREEDSPGNYTLHPRPDGVAFRTYGPTAAPTDLFFPADPVAYYLPRLKPAGHDHAKSLTAVRCLGDTRDARVVLPLIDALSAAAHVDEINEELTKVTGHNFRTYAGRSDAEKLHALWRRWWDDNRDKPRRDWLRAGLDQKPPPAEQPDEYTKAYYRRARLTAAVELARLGDDAGADLLLRELGRQDSDDRLPAAVALARLDREEGWRHLDAHLADRPAPGLVEQVACLAAPRARALLLAAWQRRRAWPDPGTRALARALWREHPKRIGADVLKIARATIAGQTRPGPLAADDGLGHALGIVACATGATPPADLTDRGKVEAFLAAAEVRLR